MVLRKKTILAATIVLTVAATITVFVIPSQPYRVLSASHDPGQKFVHVLPGGRWSVTACEKGVTNRDGTKGSELTAPVRLFDFRAGKEVAEFPQATGFNPYCPGMLSPDGSLLMVSIDSGWDLGTDTTLQLIWDLEAKKPLATLSLWHLGAYFKNQTAWFSPNSQFMVFLSRPDDRRVQGLTLQAWDRKHNRVVQLTGNTGRIAAISPDSRYVLALTSEDEGDKRVYHPAIFELQTGVEISRMSAVDSTAVTRSFGWTPDNREAIIARGIAERGRVSDETVNVVAWDPASGATRDVLSTSSNLQPVHALQFSPDGRYLALLSGLFDVNEIWDVSVNPAVFIGHSRDRNFAPTPERPIAVVGEDPVTQRLWRLGSSLKQSPVLVEGNLMIHSVAFNENRSVVSIGYFDANPGNGGKNIVEFWDTQSGRLISRFDALQAAFRGYSEDGNRFFTGNYERMEVLNDWEIVPGRPWKWILIAWLAEAVVTLLVVWLALKKPSIQPDAFVIDSPGPAS